MWTRRTSSEIARVRTDANDPGDERRSSAAERLAYLEALKAAVGGRARATRPTPGIP